MNEYSLRIALGILWIIFVRYRSKLLQYILLPCCNMSFIQVHSLEWSPIQVQDIIIDRIYDNSSLYLPWHIVSMARACKLLRNWPCLNVLCKIFMILDTETSCGGLPVRWSILIIILIFSTRVDDKFQLRVRLAPTNYKRLESLLWITWNSRLT